MTPRFYSDALNINAPMVDHYSGKPPLTAHAFGYIVAALSSTNRPPIDLEGIIDDQRILPRCARFVTVVPVRNHAGQLIGVQEVAEFIAALNDVPDHLLERSVPVMESNTALDTIDALWTKLTGNPTEGSTNK